MTRHYLSEALKTFIRERIQTVLRLEVLFLLHHHQPRAFTLREVADELGLENETVAKELSALEAVGVVQLHPDTSTYKFHPVDATLRSLVEQLVTAYSRQRVPILSVILSESPDRTRLFAEAFRIIRTND
jgi:DNA-binding IclR family transcriptional regulator